MAQQPLGRTTLILVSLMSLSAAGAQPWMDAAIGQIMSQHHLPSVSAAIVDGDSIELVAAWGDSILTPPTAATTDTAYLIASVSKPIVATALMQLVENGSITLDEPIEPFLPFAIVNPHQPASHVTVRTLLSHTSSLIDNWSVIPFSNGEPQLPLTVAAANYFVQGSVWYSSANFLSAAPGTVYQYANVNYTLAAVLIESLSGQSLEQYTQTHVFDPLGMATTSWRRSTLPAGTPVATGYNYTESTGTFSAHAPYTSNLIWPAGWLNTTPRDYSYFLAAHMNDGVYQSFQLLEPATVVEMHTLQPNSPTFGLGFWRLNFSASAGGQVVGHDGSLPGVTTFMYFSPADDRGLIFFLNVRRAQNINGLVPAINDLIFTLYPSCKPDCDGSGSLNVFDYICFGDAYANDHWYADCDLSGSLNIFDYICFGNAYANGCP